MELCTLGLLGSLITNLTSDWHFWKWGIQYGGREISETLRFSHNSVLGGFRGRWLRMSNWDNFFLAVQLFRSSLIIVRIKSQYSFGSKKNYEKKFRIFWYFSPNLVPYWISYWTKLNFDHEFLKSIPKTISQHGFRLEISLFQSWEWGLHIS